MIKKKFRLFSKKKKEKKKGFSTNNMVEEVNQYPLI